MHRRLPVRTGLATAVAVLAVTALGPATASAIHLASAVKQCAPRNPNTETFTCTLTVAVNLTNAGAPVTATITRSATNATFENARLVGGTCAPTTVTVTSSSEVSISPAPGGGNIQLCTIVIEETLRSDAFGEVCQIVTTSGHLPPITACAELRPPPLPTTVEQCKDEGYKTYGVFKNQGDCVSFITTGGKNEPRQNAPGTP